MQSLVVRYTVDISFSQIAYVQDVPFEYKSLEAFLIDYYAWCDHNGSRYTETSFLNLGILPIHRHTLEVLTLEEWFWRYKKR